ncbi:class I SAM-dependent methyltransferase [Fictibacillus sp. 23RED33]|uniref:class I SAM-dependent DNA methyltransferase n=1 Tax=Fictibacillus sp. 23RED33 TaxID=2745879 RepID=UPI0018CDF2D1|nr:class I SAM-dependent methyltransferase [Fictibacillus sp. 23RED33]MBH0175655.1 class I SAM-dependent methyltransferase [Fictibacillus sp. 23RED33]
MTYGTLYSQYYDLRSSHFSKNIAPLIREFYEQTLIGKHERSIIDLACGNGHLAHHFLDNQYRVLGIDQSEEMLELAKQRTSKYINEKSATFLYGDAEGFNIEQEEVGLVVSTYNAINHLKNLEGCFISCYKALKDKGYFIFDMNTRKGYLSLWNSQQIEDNEERLIFSRAVYDPMGSG